jgi:SAM-dependent methyltransferase
MLNKKFQEYYRSIRIDILELMPKGVKRILDLGCGEGFTGYEAKRLTDAEVIGVEIVPEIAALARARLDHVICADIEELKLDFPDGNFDCILCGDIFEHLKDPWAVLQKIKAKLAVGGVVIASFPNIQYVTAVLKILRDKFEYEEFGILDNTHLRFFTLHTIKKMFREQGFNIRMIRENRNRGLKMTLFNILTFGLLRKFSVVQFIVLAEKKIAS